MTFLIGCILIYHYDLEWGWYVAAAVAYGCEWQKHHEYHTHLYRRVCELESRLTSHFKPRYIDED
jgi:hypothetical protein